jgi:glycosyltransferase involved in cell wall biosynthesis
MIVLFTSNVSGGVIQFLIQILKELVLLKYSVTAFIPDEADVSIDETLIKLVIRYKKIKVVNVNDKRIKRLSEDIESLNPKLVWYFENGIVCSEVSIQLNKNIKQMVTMHDAGGYHPSYNTTMKMRLHNCFAIFLSRRCESICNYVLVLSEESRNKYINLKPNNKNKTVLLRLGAHIPNVIPSEPVENIPDNFFLFFGIIDLYKGIGNLLKSYSKYKGKIDLVIAGSGHLNEKEIKFIDEDCRVHLINRYIRDEEMLWLFEHTTACVLPYIEATQSGIIPIAYKYGKPVITSNVRGLTQFVDDEKTGYICTNENDYVAAYNKMENKDIIEKMMNNCFEYYSSNLDWRKNLEKLFERLELD